MDFHISKSRINEDFSDPAPIISKAYKYPLGYKKGPMEIEITLEKEDWRRFQSYIEKQLWKQQKNWTDGFWVNLVFWALMAALLMEFFHRFSEFHWPSGLFVFVICVLIAIMLFYKANKLRKANAPMESGIFCGRHKFIFTDDEIISECRGYQGRYSWEIVKKVERGGGLVLIYFDTVHAHVFPEAKLANADEFYEYVSWRILKVEKRENQNVREDEGVINRTFPMHAGSAVSMPAPFSPEYVPLIVLISGDQNMLTMMRTVLESDGYRVEAYGKGSEGLAACQQKLPDLMLIDGEMLDMDGFDVCKTLRKLPEGNLRAVLIITTLDDEESIDKAFSAGANDFVPRPISFEVLRKRVARLLDATLAERRLHYLAYHDTLTGLLNRNTFIERLYAKIDEPHDESYMIAVMFIDLNKFKPINDTHGHDAGDLLLRSVSNRILKLLKGNDLAARIGGDEFTILLDNVESEERIIRMAKEVSKSLIEPFALKGQYVYIGASIGISVFPNNSRDADTLIKYADSAMYRAKEMGNSFSFYDLSMENVLES